MISFEELLTSNHIPIAPEGNEHSRSGWIQFDCPFCEKNTHRWHMGYSLSGGYVNCWRCGSHPLDKTIAEMLGIALGRAKQIAKDIQKQTGQIEEVKIRGHLEIPEGVGPLQSAHLRYLRRRGFSPKLLTKLWGVQGIGIAPELQWRLFLPIVYLNKVMSWTTRSLSEEKKGRYLSASPEQESLPIKSLLYGLDYVRHAVIVVEGPTDVWRIGPGAVGTFGTDYTKAQVMKLLKYPTRYICFDNEPSAQKKALELCDQLSLYPGETYNVTLNSKDPGEASTKEINRLRALLE